MGKAKQVIIGNSVAALSAIKAIREVDCFCPITLISAERCNAYSPILLTYYLKGKIPREDLFIVDSDFYRLNGIRTKFGSKVLAVEPTKQTIHLESGKKVEYDNLLIATGASPVSLGSSRDGLADVLSLRTIENAEQIAERAKMAKEVIISGGGLVGLQIVDALFREGVKFTILASSRQVLSQNVDADCAAIVQKELEAYGISILFGRNIREIKKKGQKAIVVSDSGEEWTADMVIVGKGVRPNIGLVNSSGIKVNRGILVDELMRTNIDNIFAAGDVSEGENLVTGKREVLPTWSNACKQGRIAGLNMAGYEQRYEGGLRETITTLFGLTIAAVGLSKAPKGKGVEELRFSDPDRRSYRKILFANNKIVGAVLLGKTRDAGMLKSFIRSRKDISPWKRALATSPLDIRKLFLAVASG